MKKRVSNRKGKTYEELYGKEKADAYKEKIRQGKIGEKNPMYGVKQSDELKKKRSELSKKYQASLTPEKRRELMQPMIESAARTNRERVMSDDERKRRSETLKKRKLSEEHKKKISISHLGMVTYIPNEKTRIKMSNAVRGRKYPKSFGENVSSGLKDYWANLSDDEREKRYEKWVNCQKSKMTSAEENMKKILDEKGVKYEFQKVIGRYIVDFYLPDFNSIIEVYGCYWHQCSQCGFVKGIKRKNEVMLSKQIHDLDMKRIAFIESKGHIVKIVWEHQLRIA